MFVVDDYKLKAPAKEEKSVAENITLLRLCT